MYITMGDYHLELDHGLHERELHLCAHRPIPYQLYVASGSSLEAWTRSPSCGRTGSQVRSEVVTMVTEQDAPRRATTEQRTNRTTASTTVSRFMSVSKQLRLDGAPSITLVSRSAYTATPTTHAAVELARTAACTGGRAAG